MTTDPRAPRLTDRQLLMVRFVAILISYGIYRLFEPRGVVAAFFIGVGALVTAYNLIDRFALPARERSELMEIGSIVLGLGLLGIGAYLLLR